MRAKFFLSAVAASLLAMTTHVAARPLVPRLMIDRGAEDCLQIPPEELAPLALDRSKTLHLSVRVMAEPDDMATTRDYIVKTKDAFRRIGVRLHARYNKVVVPLRWAAVQDPSPNELFTFMKDRYGGERPPKTDLVYFMTRYWAGGMADCIGGIRFPDRAFAFGSIDYATEGRVPGPTANEGVIAAHELGHLLGAHHHYSNCSEAQPFAALAGDLGPCTTMSPYAGTATSIFATLEASYIRHYVERYAFRHARL